MKYAALCCIAKNEDFFLKEWLAYHALIGFEHFIIYDNNSDRPIADFLNGFAEADRVTVLRNTRGLSQETAYNHCLDAFGRHYKWIAFLDLDEFIRVTPGCGPFGDVRELLAEYETYAGLCLNWRMFSSSGHETRPEGPVVEEYTRYLHDDTHIKSIVQPVETMRCAGPHSFYPNPGKYSVNMDHFPVPGGFPACLPAMDTACVNHYYYKSRECFAAKIAKGNPCNILRRMEDFDSHLSRPSHSDTLLVPFAERLRGALAENRLPEPEAPALESFATDSQDTGSGGPAGAFLAAARRHYKEERFLQTHLCLCYAALHNDSRRSEQGTAPPDPLIALEISTLRGAVERRLGKYRRAEIFLRRAFTCGASIQAHTELAGVMLATGRTREAERLVSIIKGFPAT